MKTPPIVTVVIPAYNSEPWLSPTLQSARDQTLREIEILVVDDGSTDGTAALVRDFAVLDPRVRLIRIGNSGVGAARNAGIREARGKYIAPLDADDLWAPEKLELQVARMEEGGSEMGLVYCWLEKIDVNGVLITASYPWDLEGRVLKPLILRNFIGNASVPMFRRSCLDVVGLYLDCTEQEGSQGCEDWDLSIRLAEKFTLGLVRRPVVGYRQTGECMSLNVDWMSRSYEIVMARARARNPEVKKHVFDWSSGNFYSYLATKCYLWGDYRGCLRSIFRAISSDFMLIGNRKFHVMGLKCLYRLFTRTRGKIPVSVAEPVPPADLPLPKPRRGSWLERVQARRWEAVQTPVVKPHPL